LIQLSYDEKKGMERVCWNSVFLAGILPPSASVAKTTAPATSVHIGRRRGRALRQGHDCSPFLSWRFRAGRQPSPPDIIIITAIRMGVGGHPARPRGSRRSP
jgi:hypothetical protein